MTYQFEYEMITDCMNWKTKKRCPLFDLSYDGGYCNLSKKWVHDECEEIPEGVPEWCELVRVK